MERARTEWLAARGFDLAELERGARDRVRRRAGPRSTTSAPARLDDRLEVTVAAVEGSDARGFIVAQDGRARRRRCWSRALVTLVCLDRARWQPGAHSRRASPPRSIGWSSRFERPYRSLVPRLITQASIVVQAVMLLLVGLSLWSWWQIFLKRFQISRVRSRDTDAFEDEFWKGGDLNELYQSASQSRTGGGLAAHLRRRLPRVLEAPPAGQRRRGDAGQRAPRDARGLPARDRRPGGAPVVARHRRLGVARTSGCSAPSGAS